MVKEVSKPHLIDKWNKTDPESVSRMLQYGKQCTYEVFYTGGLRVAAQSIEKDSKSGFTRYNMTIVDWQEKIFVYDHILVDGNNCICFPIDQENLSETTSS